MSKEVDERVVSMQFDNKNFESNVQTSLGTLDKLKKSLNMDGASKGLEQVESASKRVNFSGLGNAVESVHAKFSALEVMGVTALANITNSAVDAGKKIVSALTIDPITSGFQEYETQINSVQTILANTESKGTTLQQVNSALDTLNTYADKTIYNFTEMTRNIGTFTAAGVDLNTSVSAIQGIANLAAVSGSTSQQASTAMYQLSQALSTGTLKLQDWNSVVNAGMGGQVFQDALKDTARAHGILIDQMIEDEGSFRETLQHGWITSDILTETLNKFTMAAEEGSDAWNSYKKSLMDQGYTEEQALSILKMANTATDAATKVKTFSQLWDTLKESAQSGWTQSWEIIVGDFEEAKGFLTDVSNRVGDLISTASNARNEMLSGGLSSGWKQLLGEGIADEDGYKETLKSVAKEHGVSIDDMIKAEKKLDTSLTDTEAFQKALQKGFKEGSLSSDMLTQSVHKMSAKMSKMSDEELKAAGYTTDNVLQMQKLSKSLKDGSVSMDEFAKKIARPSGRENIIQALWNAFDGLMSIIKPVKEALNEIFPPATGEQLYSVTQAILKFSEGLKISEETSGKIKMAFKGLFSAVDLIRQALVALFNAAKPIFGWIWDMIGGVLNLSASFGNWLVNLRKSVNESGNFVTVSNYVSDSLTNVGKKLKGLTKSDGFSKFIKTTGNGLASFADKIKDKFSKIGSSLAEAFENGDIERVGKILQTTLFSGVMLKIMAFIKSLSNRLKYGAGTLLDDLKLLTANASKVLNSVSGSLKAMQKSIKANMILKIAIAIGILALSIMAISGINEEQVSSALGAITTLFIELLAAMKIMSLVGGKTKVAMETTVAMIGMAIAIKILASTLKTIAELEPNEIEKGVLGIAGLAVVLTASMKILSSSTKKAVSCAFAMNAFATAIKILASVCETFAYMGWEEIGKGLVGVGALMAEIDLFLSTTKMSGKAILTATGIVILSGAIKILASVCKTFADMQWEEIGKGLAGIGGLLAEIVLFTKLTGNSKKVIATAISLTIMSASLKIIESVLRDLASLTWDDIARGLVGIGGAMMILMVAAKMFPKQDMLELSASLPVVTSALVPLAEGLLKISTISWPDLIKSLFAVAATLVMLAVGLKAMEKTLKGSGALFIASSAILILSVAILALNSGGIIGAITSLALLGGTFLILAAAAKFLAPLSGSLLKLSLSITTLGLSLTILGVGLVAIGAGLTIVLTSFITAIVALQFLDWGSIIKGLAALAAVFAVIGIAAVVLKPIISSILLFSVSLLAIGTAFISVSLSVLSIVEALEILARMGPEAAATAVEALKKIIVGAVDILPSLLDSLFAMIKTLIVGIIDMFIECIPKIVDGILKMVAAVLDSLAKYIPSIIDNLMGLIIGVINGIAARMPELIQAIFNLIQSIFSGVVQALGNIDYDTILKGIVGVGLMAAVMAALAAVASMVPMAMIGVIGIGAVIAELALVLAAIGALSQIPGLDWLINEGGSLMQSIGTAIGRFIGGIVGGISQGISASLPKIGIDLSNFMTNAMPFIEGAKKIDSAAMDGVNSLVGVILALTAANIIEGLTSWFTGGSSLTKFGEEIKAFGPCLADYANSISGVDGEVVTASVNAAEALSALANGLPRSGGLLQFLGGEQNIASFGDQLVPFGKGLSAFSDSVDGVDPESVKSAAEAGKYLAELANNIPNEGGISSWFAGENSIAKFGSELLSLGQGLAGFSGKVSDINPEAISAAATAGKALADMASCIPNEGGVVSWFAGDNSIAKFSDELILLGDGLKGFSLTIEGIDIEAVTAASSAAKSLAEMTSYIPNEGGISSWFAGENSISKFGNDLISLGIGLKGFSLAILGINTEAIVSAASAAKSLAEMTTYIPNEGGIGSWFAGGKSVSKFSDDLVSLGKGLNGFATQVAGINTEAVTAASLAAKSLAELTNSIPNEGGIGSWFAGEKSVSKFGTELENLGKGLKGFATQVTGIDTKAVTAAANAAKTIAEMTNIIPNEGGIASWFCGEKSLSKFGGELTELGKGINGFSNEITDVNPEKVSSAANAAKTIAELTNTAPENMDRLTTFGSSLITFGENLNSYFSNISGVKTETITISKSALSAIKDFGTAFDPEKTKAAVEVTNKMVDMVKGMSNVTSGSTAGFSKSMSELGKANVDPFVKAFKDAEKDMTDAGKNLMTKLMSAIKDKKSDIEKLGQDILKKFTSGIKNSDHISKAKASCADLVDKCANAIKNEQSSFTEAGEYLVDGFSDGIDSNIFKAEASAKAMAKAAYDAAKDELDINSPSRVFRKMGRWVPEGFAQGINRFSGLASKSSEEMARDSIKGTSNAISRIADLINSDIDAQPTIRPVIDLTNVKSGANAISGMLSGRRTISLNTDSVGVVSASMANYQNGRNSDEIVSAIKALRSDIANIPRNNYNINGISYDDGSNISTAVRELVRAAKIERRI